MTDIKTVVTDGEDVKETIVADQKIAENAHRSVADAHESAADELETAAKKTKEDEIKARA